MIQLGQPGGTEEPGPWHPATCGRHCVPAAHSEVMRLVGPLEPTLRAGAGARRKPAQLCPSWGATLSGGWRSRPLSPAEGPCKWAPEGSVPPPGPWAGRPGELELAPRRPKGA